MKFFHRLILVASPLQPRRTFVQALKDKHLLPGRSGAPAYGVGEGVREIGAACRAGGAQARCNGSGGFHFDVGLTAARAAMHKDAIVVATNEGELLGIKERFHEPTS